MNTIPSSKTCVLQEQNTLLRNAWVWSKAVWSIKGFLPPDRAFTAQAIPHISDAEIKNCWDCKMLLWMVAAFSRGHIFSINFVWDFAPCLLLECAHWSQRVIRKNGFLGSKQRERERESYKRLKNWFECKNKEKVNFVGVERRRSNSKNQSA
jgi:hypothetical protein